MCKRVVSLASAISLVSAIGSFGVCAENKDINKNEQEKKTRILVEM